MSAQNIIITLPLCAVFVWRK